MEQRTEEWFAARLGKVTASRIADVMAKKETAARINYMTQLLCERLTGRHKEVRQTDPMRRGTELEPKARAVYMLETGFIVEEVGCIDHPTIPMAAASPDGLVDSDGLIEIKCPNEATHLEFLRTGEPQESYIKQMMWQMACTGRKWCDFVSYDDRFPERLAYKCVRIERNDAKIAEIELAVSAFLHELDNQLQELNAA